MSRHKILFWWPIVLSHPKHNPRPVVCVTKARFSEQVHPFHGVSLSDKRGSSLQLLSSAVAMWSVGSPTYVFLCRSPIVPSFLKHFFTEGLQEQRPSAGGVSEFIGMVQATEAVHRQTPLGCANTLNGMSHLGPCGREDNDAYRRQNDWPEVRCLTWNSNQHLYVS